jgi:cell division septation protein DedD
VENRLQALVASYQNHDISSETALAERAIVLDALMPANPQRREALPKRVTDQASADSEADRLNRMEAARVISADEASRARAQLYAGVPAPEPSMTPAAATASEPVASTPPPMSAPALPPSAKPAAPVAPKAAPPELPPPSSLNEKGPAANAVALASYSSEAQANQGWAALQKQFPAQLASLSMSVKPETTKSGATFYRINAGPITNRDAAIAVCKAIRDKRQYCEPALLR